MNSYNVLNLSFTKRTCFRVRCLHSTKELDDPRAHHGALRVALRRIKYKLISFVLYNIKKGLEMLDIRPRRIFLVRTIFNTN